LAYFRHCVSESTDRDEFDGILEVEGSIPFGSTDVNR
jgi:hypothetical protein